jgi:CRISPR-associated protein Csm4
MKIFRFSLLPKSPFGTPLAGDTLFGNLCWAIRERSGERALTELLDGYLSQRPFLVMSDGFPSGCLPRPTAPDFRLGISSNPSQRKTARSHRWLLADQAGLPLAQWLAHLTEREISELLVVTENTINRLTGTTGSGEFAPRQVERTFFHADARLDIYAAFDDARLAPDMLEDLLKDIGLHGYGRDATAGLGKFEVAGRREVRWPRQTSRSWLALAPCAPDPGVLDGDRCFYLPVTRFGRHGNLAVARRKPFKTPLLMAATGALLQSREPVSWTFHGRGLGGRDKPISHAIPDTVHQGYAPLVPLDMGDGT